MIGYVGNRGTQLVQRLLGRDTQDDDSNVESDNETTATLFVCPECETTYIGQEMQTCSQCDCDVESIPNGRDLGFNAGR